MADGEIVLLHGEQVCGNIHTNDLRRKAPAQSPPSPSEIKHPLPGGKPCEILILRGLTVSDAGPPQPAAQAHPRAPGTRPRPSRPWTRRTIGPRMRSQVSRQ